MGPVMCRGWLPLGRQILSDDDFNKLKEDLVWEGSKVAYLNRNETLFLNAMSAYLKGKATNQVTSWVVA